MAIGGYFELELNNSGSIYHNTASALNSGRNALKFILMNNKVKRILLPYYSCEVLLQPINNLGIDYSFYHIDEKFNPINRKICKNDTLLYINYFGLKNNSISDLQEQIDCIIIDNSQAFYDMPVNNIPTFYSPRKFFGVPDGGFAYTSVNKLPVDVLPVDDSIDRFKHLIMRIDLSAEQGYEYYHRNENLIHNIELKRMSSLTQALMKNIEFAKIKTIRLENYDFLKNKLNKYNELSDILSCDNYSAPMIYPFLNQKNKRLRDILLKHKIYTPIYWENVNKWLDNSNSYEHYLVENLIPLPIDQRYGIKTMEYISNIIIDYYE